MKTKEHSVGFDKIKHSCVMENAVLVWNGNTYLFDTGEDLAYWISIELGLLE